MAAGHISDADRQRAREIAEAAPPFTTEQRDKIRLILASAVPRETFLLWPADSKAQAMAESCDAFYGGQPAPLSEVTAAIWEA